MPLNYEDIVKLTSAETKQNILTFLDGLGFAATSWQEGSVPLACVEIGADLWAKGTEVAFFLKELGLNRTSTGAGLTRFSRSHYKNERVLATAAQRKITLTCATGLGPHTINIGDVVASDTEHTFRNIAGNAVVYPFVLAGGASKQFLFEAEVPGTASNVAPGFVTELITTLAGVTITSDIVEYVGTDDESDPRLQTRNESKWGRLSEFETIRDACENIALEAADGIKKVSVDDQNPRGEGTFDVYVAGETTTAGAGDVADAQAAFNARVFGTGRALVIAAPTLDLDLSGTVWHSKDFTSADVQVAVEAALTEFLKTIPLGGFDYTPGPLRKVPKNDIETVIANTTINGVKAVKSVLLTTPGLTDVSVGLYELVIEGTWALFYSPVTGVP